MPRPGESFGKYKLIRRIGLGGMAEVWLARVSGPGGFAKTLVVKTVLEHQAQNAEFVAQFLDEARLVALLTHPNIVQIFELGEAEGTYFIAMEYVRGQDLQNVRKRSVELKKSLPTPLLARMACGVCGGLHYAHALKDDQGNALNLVHRDVSPENILISYDGVVKLVDFGIAKASISQVTTRAGLFKGKLHYATPERLLGKPLDRRDDIYGLGAVLYEATVGRPPITGQSEGEMVKKIIDGDFPPPSDAVPEIPREFERIILKCMAWEVADRYSTARDVQVDLERYIASTGDIATPFELSQFMHELFEDEATATGQFSEEELAAAAEEPEPVLSKDFAEATPTQQTPAEPAPPVDEQKPPVGPPPEFPPGYVDDDPPVVPRRKLGLLAGGAAALLSVVAIAVVALWAPWAPAGGEDADGGTIVRAGPDGGLGAVDSGEHATPSPDASDAATKVAPADAQAEAEAGGGDGSVLSFEDSGTSDEPPPSLTGDEGRLVIRGHGGCSVREGDRRIGRIPLDKALPAGEYDISVRCAHGNSRRFSVTIRAGETTTEAVRLRSGSLLLLVSPWAEVFVDGRRRGITPMGPIELLEGSHSVRLVNRDLGVTKNRRVRIRPGERETLRVHLNR